MEANLDEQEAEGENGEGEKEKSEGLEPPVKEVTLGDSLMKKKSNEAD